MHFNKEKIYAIFFLILVLITWDKALNLTLAKGEVCVIVGSSEHVHNNTSNNKKKSVKSFSQTLSS